MSEIAEDIRKAAEAAVSSAYQTGVELQMHQSFALVEKVAEAILAERDWCLSIINEYQGRCLNHRDHAVCMELAMLVRSGREA